MLSSTAKTFNSTRRLPGQPVALRHSFASRPANARPHPQRRQQLRVSAGRWPDEAFVAQALEAFPDKGVASTEEGKALVSNGGYKYLDVRPKVELEDFGKVTGSVNIPIMNASKKWSSEKKKKVYTGLADNPDFISLVEKSFPDKEAKILVACSDGKRYSMDALMALDEAGYTGIVGLKGGYMQWFRTFDNKGNRRVFQEYEEDHFKGGDSCGIHGSGQGFERSDFVELFPMPEYEE